MAGCWSCDAPIGVGEVFCGCGAIQPPQNGKDAFAVLGVPKQFAQDAADLEKKYKDWTRKLHPDRFVKADPRARRFALERATQLNDAYKLLKQPARRAEYLLKLNGIDVADEKKTIRDPEFLMEMLEKREQLAEADGEGRVALGEAMRTRREAALTAAANAFANHDLQAAAREVIALRYFDRFLEELDAGSAVSDQRAG
jgi:molecular chaperone HscB